MVTPAVVVVQLVCLNTDELLILVNDECKKN